MSTRIFVHVSDLSLGHLACKYSANPLPSGMHMQHDLDGLLLIQIEEATQYFDHEIHGGEIVVEQQYLEQRWPRHLRPGGFQRQTVSSALFVFGFVGHGDYVAERG